MVILPGSFNTALGWVLPVTMVWALFSVLPLKHLFFSFFIKWELSLRSNWNGKQLSTFGINSCTFQKVKYLTPYFSIIFCSLSYWTWGGMHMSSHFTSIILIWIFCLKLWYSFSTDPSRQTNYLLMELFWNNATALGSFFFISHVVVFGCFPSVNVNLSTVDHLFGWSDNGLT